MFKKLIVMISAFATFNALAEAQINRVCVTDFPTTSVAAQTNNDEVVVRVIHHNGFKYMPLYTGIITPNGIQALSEKADLFEKLGDQYEFRWDLKDCVIKNKEIYHCDFGKPAVINGISVKPFSMWTKKVREESTAGVFEQMEVNFTLTIDKSSQHFSMSYQKHECYDYR